MYLGAPDAVQALWSVLREALDLKSLQQLPDAISWPQDLHAHWLAPTLLLSQTCGYPLTHSLKGQVQLLGCFRYTAPGCEGIELMLLVCAAVIAWPGSARRRLIGVTAACVLLTMANDLRLAVLLKAIEVDRASFEWLHSFGGPLLMVAIAAGFLMFWTRPLSRDTR